MSYNATPTRIEVFMKDWKFLLAVAFIAAILGKIFLPGGDHAASPQGISVSVSAPTGACVTPNFDIDNNGKFYVCGGDLAWHRAIPPGTTVITMSACGPGWTEVTSLNGQIPIGTIAANTDVGTAGGSLVLLSGISPTTKVIFCQLP